MVGFFTTEATIKSKDFGEEELLLMEKHMFLQRSLTAKQLLHGAKGRKTAHTHPESAFGRVLIGWALRRSLIHNCFCQYYACTCNSLQRSFFFLRILGSLLPFRVTGEFSQEIVS